MADERPLPPTADHPSSQVAGDRLDRYRAKRSFDRTPEPSGATAPRGDVPRFVVQKHDARRLHYDFRLEAEGVLISWAVPKGPSYNPRTKRLAVHVEDHPLDYEGFEGVIPEAQYGSGTVIVWDEGTYRNLTERQGRRVDVAQAVRNGHLSLWLDGTKLHGGWSLTRTAGQGGKESWILVKRSDEHADAERDITAAEPDSVRTGRSLETVGSDGSSERWTRERATWRPPMLARLVRPSDHSRTRSADSWVYERKLDGLRCVAVRNGDRVELWSRNHLSFNARFPQLVATLGQLPIDNFTFDGEIVAFDGERTSFARLQGPDRSTEPVYCVFDLLHLLGQDTAGLPLPDRQALLAQALVGTPDTVRTVTGVDGDPAERLRQACADGWEGLIAKRAAAPYRSGRSNDWQKLKCMTSQELVIGGWTDPSGARAGFGALLVGYFEDEGLLHYAGKVGSGFDERVLRELHSELTARARPDSPFAEPIKLKGAHWARPELVGSIAFTEWTRDGRLRHPSFQGLRPDTPARSVRREG